MKHATRLPHRTRQGQELWVLPGYSGRLVLKDCNERRGKVAVTYLPAGELRRDLLSAELEAAAREDS